MSVQRRRPWVTVAFVLALLVAPAGAQAASHPFLPAASSVLQPAPPFDDPCGVAVDSQARFYVSDYQGGAINLLSPEFPPGSNPAPLVFSLVSRVAEQEPSNWRCELAVDSADNLYANDYHQGVVKYVGGSPVTIDPGPATGVAIDPATDRLYVVHRTHILAYEADGSPVLDGGVPLKIGLGSLTDGYGLAVSGFAVTGGHVYVADAFDDTVKVYDPAADPLNPVQTIDGTATPQKGFVDLTYADLAISDSTGELFVVDNLEPGVEHPVAAVDVFDPTGSFIGQLPPASVRTEDGFRPKLLIHGGPSGIAVDNSTQESRGLIYVTSGDDRDSAVYAFCPTAPTTALLDGVCPDPSPSVVLEVSRAGSGEGRVTNAIQGIECGSLCAREFDLGTELALFATPRVRSTFMGWSVNGSSSVCPGTGTCKVILGADTEVVANFAPIPQRTLTLAKAGSGAGTVTSSPVGIACGSASACVAEFDQGAQVTLTPEAAPGSEFAGWSGACSGLDSCQVSLAADVAVSATFVPASLPPTLDRARTLRTLAISVSGEGAGTITSDPAGIECGTPCSGAYAPGTKVTLTAKPDDESAFTGWSGCDTSKGTTCTVTLGSSKTVGASFAEATPLEIGGVSLNGAKATLSVVVPSKGTLSAKAKQIKPVSAKARKAETLSLPLVLNKAAKKALAQKGKLKVKVTLTFKPQGAGEPRTLEKTITFRKKAAARKAGKK